MYSTYMMNIRTQYRFQWSPIYSITLFYCIRSFPSFYSTHLCVVATKIDNLERDIRNMLEFSFCSFTFNHSLKLHLIFYKFLFILSPFLFMQSYIMIIVIIIFLSFYVFSTMELCALKQKYLRFKYVMHVYLFKV